MDGFEYVWPPPSKCFDDAVDLPIGITCVANGVILPWPSPRAVGARWIRANQWVNAYVANEGIINGPAGAVLRYRSGIGARDVAVFADVHVKFGAHAITADRAVEEQARDAEFFDADLLIASGQRTGSPTETGEVRAIQAGTSLPVIVGNGLDVDNASRIAPGCGRCNCGQFAENRRRLVEPGRPCSSQEADGVVRSVRNRT